MSDRVILHCDLNSFFASVETVLNPALANVPMAVCGDPEKRHGIVLAKNELAKKCGIVTAETIWQAKQKCPNLVTVIPHHSKYDEYSKKAREIFLRYTDLVEPFGCDEAWLDVTGTCHLFEKNLKKTPSQPISSPLIFSQPGEEIADKIRTNLRQELGLTASVGVSFNKVFAKLGSDYKKPDATTVISREHGKKIVFPMPVENLLFVGRSAKKTLSELHIRTIRDLAHYDRDILISKLGKLGGMIHDYANGKDDSPVLPYTHKQEVKSIGNSTTFPRDLITEDEIKKGVRYLADSVARRLRNRGLMCSALQVGIKDPNFRTIQRQKQLTKPTHLIKTISDTAMELIHANWRIGAPPSGTPIRLINITAINLVSDITGGQISFFDDDIKDEKQEKLEDVLELIRRKFGSNTHLGE